MTINFFEVHPPFRGRSVFRMSFRKGGVLDSNVTEWTSELSERRIIVGTRIPSMSVFFSYQNKTISPSEKPSSGSDMIMRMGIARKAPKTKT